MTNRETAADAVQEGEWAFRLTGETPVYEMPDASAKVVATLPAGSIVTVQDRAGEFLHVITPLDSFGYIPSSTPMTPVEGRSVDDWHVLMPEIEPVSIPMTARIPAPMEPGHHAPPDVTGLEGSRRRDALVFLSRLNEKAEGADRSPDNWAFFSGIAAATLGMLGLLLAHALFGLTNNELMVFFAGDVLFPLAVLTGKPKAPTAALGLMTMLYYVALFGYAGVMP